MKLNFDSQYNPQRLTFILAKKDGTKLGALPAQHIKINAEFNSCWDINFSVYQINDGHELNIWNSITDFKLLWVKEFDLWFEIHIQVVDNGNVAVKHITAKSLAQMELAQTNLYDIEINTETDIERDDYKPTIFYNAKNKSCSLLHRILSKTPHYNVSSVPVSLCNMQRTFSFDGISVYEALKEISEEVGCYFDFAVHSDENGKPQRAFKVYDLESYCLDCGARGEFKDTCEECKSSNVINGYGDDTNIFVSTHNLTDEITFETNEDSVKNCFKLEAGDELMTATVINCNPNGSGYLWYIPQFMKNDMPEELVSKIDAYDNLVEYYENTHSVSLTSSLLTKYNKLISKYLVYNSELTTISPSIIGFPALMNEYYNTIDFNLLLQSSLMPSEETVDTSASEQAARLTPSRLSPVAVYSLTSASASTVNSAVLAMAKAQIDYRYQVKILSSSYSNYTWTGSFTVTNYYNEKDTANSEVVSITIVDNCEDYVQQMLDKSLANTTDYATDIVAMFELQDSEFILEMQKYSLARLKAFNDSCEACLNILIEQGAANKETWDGSDENLYDDLYTPYRNKQYYIQTEIQLRESEIQTITDVQNEIIKFRNQIQNALNFENYLGTDLWLTFITYRREDTYSNSNYISDGLDNAELFNRALQFIVVAKKELYKSANLQHSLSSTLKNLLVMNEFKELTDKFELGNFIHIQCDEKFYDIRLLSFEIDFDNLDDLPVTFSDVREIRDDISDIKDILNNSKSMASSYDNVASQAEQGKESRSQLDGWIENGLALTSLKIINSADNQDYVFNEHGMLFRKYQPLSDTYSDEQLKIINSTIAITNDNWKTVKTAVGSHYYIDPLTNTLTYAYGINGEVIVGKIILGEQLGIYNSGATLQFNKNGLYITNGTNSFALNPNTSENLLSIKNATTDILRVSDNGLYLSGEIVATSGYIGGKSGWTIKTTYIYNGKTSLSDETQGIYIGTDGLSIGDANSYIKLNKNGKFVGNDVDIIGGTLNINDNFIVDKYGNVKLNGDITWGVGSSPTQVLYAQSYDDKPSDKTLVTDYPKDGKAFDNIAIDDNNNIHFEFYGNEEVDLSGSETSLSATLDDAYGMGIGGRNIEVSYNESQNSTTLTRSDTNKEYQITAQITDAYDKTNILLIESLKCAGGWNGASFNIKNLPITFGQSSKVILSYYYDNPGATGLIGNYMTLVLKVNGSYYGVKSDSSIVSAQWNNLTFDFSNLITSVNENYKIEEAILYFYDVVENGTTGQYYSTNFSFWVDNKIGISEFIFENPNELGSVTLSGWHQTYTNGDIYASYTYDGGNTWGMPVRIVGEDGADGKDGSDADVNYENVFNALTDNGKRQGLFYNGTDGNVYINAAYIKAGTIDASKVTITGKLYFGSTKTYYIDVNSNSNYINLPGFKVNDEDGAVFSGTLSAPKGDIAGWNLDETQGLYKTTEISIPDGTTIKTLAQLDSTATIKVASVTYDSSNAVKQRMGFVCVNGSPFIVMNRIGDGYRNLPALTVIMQDGLNLENKDDAGFHYPKKFQFYVRQVTINRDTDYEETFYTLMADTSLDVTESDGSLLGLWKMTY